MVTAFIKRKDVKEKLKKLFKKPYIEQYHLNKKITDYNAPLVGNALDYFISCHFDYLKQTEEKNSFIKNAKEWAEDLNKNSISHETIKSKQYFGTITTRTYNIHFNFLNNREINDFIEKTKELQKKINNSYKSYTNKKGITKTQRTITCHFKFPNQDTLWKFIRKSHSWLDEMKKVYIEETTLGKRSQEEIKETKIYTPDQRYYVCYKNNVYQKYTYELGTCNPFGVETVYCYSHRKIAELLDKSLIEYNNYKAAGKITDRFLEAILILAQILPGIKFSRLGKDTGNPSKNDVTNLKRLIKQIPKSIYEGEKVHINPKLGGSLVGGEPDYVIDDLILDIKTTKELFPMQDYHQLLCYYLLYKIDEKWWNKEGITINKIGIYYSLYGELIQFNMADLCNPEELEEAINFIKETKWAVC